MYSPTMLLEKGSNNCISLGYAAFLKLESYGFSQYLDGAWLNLLRDMLIILVHWCL